MIKKLTALCLIMFCASFIYGCEEETLEVTVKTDPEKGGMATGEGTYVPGEEIILTAEPEEGYKFVNWTEDGQEVGFQKNLEMTVESDKEFTANFVKIEDKIGIEVGSLVLKDGYEEADWPFDKVKDTVEKALKVYDRQSKAELAASIFKNEAANKLDKGKLTLHYPAVDEFIDELQVTFEKMVVGREEVEVHAAVKFPHIEEKYFQDIAGEIADKTVSGEGPVSFSEIYSQVLVEREMSLETTGKKIILEEGQEGLVVTYIDEPEKMFASLDRLFEKAVAEEVTEVIVQAGEGNIISVLDDNPARAEYRGSIISITNLEPYYLADKTTFLTEDGTEIQLKKIWEQLLGMEDTTIPLLSFDPDSFLHHIRIGETSPGGNIPVYLTRPYAVATMDAAAGYVNIETGEANIIEVISGSGEGASDFYWSPGEKYAAYSWTESGSGFNFLHVYDIEEDEIISFNDLKETDQQEGFVGEFELQWMEDGKTLQVDVKEAVEPGTDEKDREITSWKLDAAERKLSRLE